MDTRSCRQACKWPKGRTGSVAVCHSTSLHKKHQHMYTSTRLILRSNTQSSQLMDETWRPSINSFTQQDVQFMLAEQVPPVAMVMTCSPVQRLGILIALLIGVVVPHLWGSRSKEIKHRRHLEDLVIYNAADLQKQKNKFQRALSFDVDLGDKEVPQDLPRKMAAAPHQSSYRGSEVSQQGSDTMRHQWESFMAMSKSEQVKDVWDARGLPEVGVPTASKKQLEEMTARVRAANTGTSKKDYVSFDELCRGEEDFDAGMADRVAQRKARFQGQFLTDADVGLPSAPKRSSSRAKDNEMAGPRAPGNGRLSNMTGGSMRQQRQVKEADSKSLDEEPGRGALLEVRPRERPSFSSSTDGPSSSGPLLEIRPKRSQPRASQDSASLPETSSSQPKQEANCINPLGDQVNSKNAGRPFKLNLSSIDIADEEFDQSLRLRGAVDYVHPSIAPKIAGRLLNEVPLKSASPSTYGALQLPHTPRLPQEIEQPGPASASMGELRSDESIGDRGSESESALPLFAPVSSVSVGLLKGASMVRRRAEAMKLNIEPYDH